MRYDDFRRSDNIDDRRDDEGGGLGGGGGFGIPMGGGGLGIGTIIVLGLVGWAFGIDPRILIGGAEILTGGGQSPTYQTDRRPAPRKRRADRRDGQHDLRRAGRDRRSLERNLQGQRADLYRARASCCSAMPPMAAAAAWRSPRWARSIARRTSRSFSTPDFFRQVETRFRGCSGNACKFTAAYIIAHEAGHHIQNLLGILPRVTRLQQQAGSKAEANALQVRVELQADCLSGVWVNREEKKRPNFLEAGRHRRRADNGDRDRRRYAAAAGARAAWCRIRSRMAPPRNASAGS